MSTRSNIIIKDSHTKLFFYRHSDGYISGAGQDLAEFVKGYIDGSMRDDASQSAGWLIIRGRAEYSSELTENGREARPITSTPNKEDRYMGWKVGAYEPTDGLSGDIEYLYIIDLDKKTLEARKPKSGFWDKATITNTTRIELINFGQSFTEEKE